MVTLVGLLLAFVSLLTGAVYLASAALRQGNPPSSCGEPWNDAEPAGFVWNEPEPADTQRIGAIQNVSGPHLGAFGADLEFDRRVMAVMDSVPGAAIGPDLHTTLALAGDRGRKLQVQALLLSYAEAQRIGSCRGRPA